MNGWVRGGRPESTSGDMVGPVNSVPFVPSARLPQVCTHCGPHWTGGILIPLDKSCVLKQGGETCPFVSHTPSFGDSARY